MKKNTVTKEQIEKLYKESSKGFIKVGDKTCLCHCILPNGFVLIEHSSCVDAVNYDKSIGENLCKKRIQDKMWELEGYLLQSKLNS